MSRQHHRDDHSQDEDDDQGGRERAPDRDRREVESQDRQQDVEASHGKRDTSEQDADLGGSGSTQDKPKGRHNPSVLAANLRGGGTVGRREGRRRAGRRKPDAATEDNKPRVAETEAENPPKKGGNGDKRDDNESEAAGENGPARAKAPEQSEKPKQGEKAPKGKAKAKKKGGADEAAAQAEAGTREAPEAIAEVADADAAPADAEAQAAGGAEGAEGATSQGAAAGPAATTTEEAGGSSAALESAPGEREGAGGDAKGGDGGLPAEVVALQAQAPGPLAAVLERQVAMGKGAVDALKAGLEGATTAALDGLAARSTTTGGSVSAGYHHAATAVRAAAKKAGRDIADTHQLAADKVDTAVDGQSLKTLGAINAAKAKTETTTTATMKRTEGLVETTASAFVAMGRAGADDVTKFVRGAALPKSSAPLAVVTARKKNRLAQKAGGAESAAQRKMGRGLEKGFRKLGVKGGASQQKTGVGTTDQLGKWLDKGNESVGKMHTGWTTQLSKNGKAGIKGAAAIGAQTATKIETTGKAARRAVNRSNRKVVEGVKAKAAQHRKELNTADGALLANQAKQLEALLPVFEKLLKAAEGGPAAAPAAQVQEATHANGANVANVAADAPKDAEENSETTTASESREQSASKKTESPGRGSAAGDVVKAPPSVDEIAAKAEAIAQKLLARHVTQLAAMYGKKQGEIGALTEAGKAGMGATEQRHRATAKKMSNEASQALTGLTTKLSGVATALLATVKKSMASVETATTTTTKAALEGVTKKLGADELQIVGGSIANLTRLQPALSKRTANFKARIEAKALALATKDNGKSNAKTGALRKACETNKEGAAAKAVRGMTGDQSFLLREGYRAKASTNASTHILQKLDEGSERTEALHWVMGRRRAAAKTVLLRAADDDDAMADLETALRSLGSQERKDVGNSSTYRLVAASLADEVSETDAAVVEALVRDNEMKADVLRTAEAMEDKDDIETAAGHLAKYAGDPEKREAFAKMFQSTTFFRTLGQEIDSRMGKGSAYANLLHNSASGDKVGAKAARVQIAFDDKDEFEQADAMEDRVYARARNNEKLRSEDPKERAKAEKELAVAKANHEAVNERYKQDYGLGVVDMKSTARHKATKLTLVPHLARLLTETAERGSADLTTKLIAGTQHQRGLH